MTVSATTLAARPETLKCSYATAIHDAHAYLLRNYPEVFVIGQGTWNPWYAGGSIAELEKEFGRERVMDTPVSEAAVTGLAIGASICGYRPIVLHPRMDFMLLAADVLVNQAAKWAHMLNGNERPAVTIRAVINRGGEQGAQHSQALHSWFAHIPGLRVVMPATAADARDLLIAATLCNDPVLYIDDRWLYELEGTLPPPEPLDLRTVKPQILRQGKDITLVAAGYSVQLALETAKLLAGERIEAEVVDLRAINPIDHEVASASVKKTGRLCAIDGSWSNCGLAAEIITGVSERVPPSAFKTAPIRITLPDAPAPAAKTLEAAFYPTAGRIAARIHEALR